MTKVQALFVGGELHGRQEVLPSKLQDFVAHWPEKAPPEVGADAPVTSKISHYRLQADYRDFALYAPIRMPIENVVAALLRWVVERQSVSPFNLEVLQAHKDTHDMDAAMYQQIWQNLRPDEDEHRVMVGALRGASINGIGAALGGRELQADEIYCADPTEGSEENLFKRYGPRVKETIEDVDRMLKYGEEKHGKK